MSKRKAVMRHQRTAYDADQLKSNRRLLVKAVLLAAAVTIKLQRSTGSREMDRLFTGYKCDFVGLGSMMALADYHRWGR